MSEQATAISEHEAAHAPHADHGGGAADPPSGMHEWWKTPASLIKKPVAVDPAIYGIDASDVGGDVGGNAAAVAETFAQVSRDHVGPTSLDAYIGIEGAGSAQAAGPSPQRLTEMQKADAGRAHAMQDQLLISAKHLESLVDQIDQTLLSDAGERGPQGLVEQLETLVAQAQNERKRIVLVAEQRHPDSAVQNGALHVSRANHLLQHAVARVKKYASAHKVSVNEKKLLAADGVDRDVIHLEGSLPKQDPSAAAKVGRVTDSEQALTAHSLRESLDGALHATEGLVMAVREAAPAQVLPQVMPAVLSCLRMLDASVVDGIKSDKSMRSIGRRIIANLETAERDARALNLPMTELELARGIGAVAVEKLDRSLKEKR